MLGPLWASPIFLPYPLSPGLWPLFSWYQLSRDRPGARKPPGSLGQLEERLGWGYRGTEEVCFEICFLLATLELLSC